MKGFLMESSAMKKGFIIIFLTLAVAGGLFAQAAISWNGIVWSGLLLRVQEGENEEGEEAMLADLTAYNPVEQGDRFRVRLGGQIENAAKNFGVAFKLHFNDRSFENNNLFAWAWFKPLDNLWLNFGKMDTNLALGIMGGFEDYSELYAPTGLQARYDPIPGLNIVAAANLAGENAPQKQKLIQFGDYSLGVKYTMTNVFAGSLGVRQSPMNTDKTSGGTELYASFDYVGLAKIGLAKLAVDFHLERLNEFGNYGTFSIGPMIHFEYGKISAQLKSYVYIPVLNGQKFDYLLSLYGQYAVSPGISVGLRGHFQYDDAGERTADYRYWDGIENKSMSAGGESSFMIAPYTVFNFNKTADLEVGYACKTLWSWEPLIVHLIYASIIYSY